MDERLQSPPRKTDSLNVNSEDRPRLLTERGEGDAKHDNGAQPERFYYMNGDLVDKLEWDKKPLDAAERVLSSLMGQFATQKRVVRWIRNEDWKVMSDQAGKYE